MEVDYATHDLNFSNAFIWIEMLQDIVSEAKARFSRTLNANLSINHHPRIHWWFRVIPVPSFQMLVLVMEMVVRSMGLIITAMLYANHYYDTILYYGAYMIFGANTFTFSDYFVGDLFAFWGSQNSRFKSMVEYVYKQQIIHQPSGRFLKRLRQVFPYMFWSKVNFVVTSSGASCTAISDHNDTFVSCQFRNETFIHGIFNNLNQAGFSPQASSTLASTTFISVALWAAFFTISIFFFSTVNILRSPVVNGQHVSSAVAGIKRGWSPNSIAT
ncbi:predicted protein [Meyerozyma guilliermondii ATCC 6260]|uniref:Uncharacterized protein n=1 Tax=Meyerozyma guilliermondii (strain ATCC 6260 / CBS 566 / DSM 6381 / JCM 1539 / NBRC 10279 / NRRL Y-324) TaxID=294746 RepID=A5DQ73_PICGU|nr:uncharacterized protein PGUG_05424 [Meyerozyma guilliermondii ATCC 6260]EDK41326.2 predicted protein [Meyerozyma guilliermondii ATCC 6260]